MTRTVMRTRFYRERAFLATWCWALAHGEPIRPSHQRQQQHQQRLPWGLSPLPSLPKQGQTFLNECQDFVAIFERLRGGDYFSSDYNGDRYDDDYYSSDSRYGGDDGNDDDYYYGSGGDGRNDDYYYNDRGAPRQKSGGGGSSSFVDSLPSLFKTGDRRIGLSLVGGGSVITMLGISLFFNKALMRLGNLLFIAGVAITMGIQRTMAFFFKPEKMRATICLGVGIFLVFIGSPVFGIVLEVFGLLNLFGNMFPMLLAIARTLPGIGPILSNNNNKSGRSSNNNRGNSRRTDYYDDYNDGRNDGYYNEYYDDQGGYGQDDRYNDDRHDDGGGYY